MERPPLPSPSTVLHRYLVSPENLPIHNFRKCQKMWDRKSNPESIYHIPLCSLTTDIDVVRDMDTGELLGFHEVEIKEAGLRSTNSTSLKRAPAPPGQSIIGDPTNFPFWPGGLSEPINRLLDSDTNCEDIDFEKDLLTIPPGFDEGVALHSQNPKEEKEPIKQDTGTSLQDLISGLKLSWTSLLQSEECDPEAEEVEEKDAEKEDNDETKEEIDTLTKGGEESHLVPAVAPSKPPSEWAVKVNLKETIDDFHYRVPNMAHKWPFELDTFQKQAVLRLESHESVFVAAHTSAGKTVVAEYAIALSLSHMTRTIYTSPIKALSNQKFRDFRTTFGEEKIGLITGDVQINKEAPCLIMTTEILRSMLYNGSEVIRDVEWVVFDEVHYINDSERGVVWEEVMIMLPDHVRLILLSATVPNAMQFADWVGRTKQKQIYVISTYKRPVPLQHFLYTGNSKMTSDQLFMIVNENREFITKGYHSALTAKKERDNKKSGSKFGPKVKQMSTAQQDKNVWLSLINMLNKKDKLPVVAFTLSRKRCDDNADSLTSLDLTTSEEKHKISIFFKKSVSLLKGSDRQLPQVLWMQDILRRGIAVHHSGILPIIKEVIEMLFQQGLVKLLFATETFAMGVNMPARTVVFDSTRKHDGTTVRDLYPGEYIQMAGRAGRRGLDSTGTVILLCKADVPESSDLNKMILGTPTQLESQFRLTYNMLLNIMRCNTLRVEDIMKRSYSEIDSMKHEVNRQQKMESVQEQTKSMEQLDCPVCLFDIDQCYNSTARINELQQLMKTLFLKQFRVQKALSPGRVVILFTECYHYCLAVILHNKPQQSYTAKSKQSYTVLMLCNHGDDSEDAATSLVSLNSNVVKPYTPIKELFRPEGEIRHTVLEIGVEHLFCLTSRELSVDGNRIINDYKNRQIPRFRGNPPGRDTSSAVQELLLLVDLYSQGGLQILDPVKDLRVTDMEYVEMRDEKDKLVKLLSNFSCLECPLFTNHFEHARKKAELQKTLRDLRYWLSEDSLQLLPEYHQKVQVLQHLGYLSKRGVVQLKGRVACEAHTQEMIVTELFFRNTLSEFEPAEIAALLSSLVLQQSKCEEPTLTDRLKKGKEMMLAVARDIADVELRFGLSRSADEYEKELKFGLVEVVYEWAKGKEFVDIIGLTDILEGVIVKCIQRLDDLCRDIIKAARVVGDRDLGIKMREVSNLIRRDIVFAASLYTI